MLRLLFHSPVTISHTPSTSGVAGSPAPPRMPSTVNWNHIAKPLMCGIYPAVHHLVGRAFVCLFLELASRPSQPAKLPTARAGSVWQGSLLQDSFPKNLTLQSDGPRWMYGEYFILTWALHDVAALRLIPIPSAGNSAMLFCLRNFSGAVLVARPAGLAARSPWSPCPFAVGWKVCLKEVTVQLFNAHLVILLISCRPSCYFGPRLWRRLGP